MDVGTAPEEIRPTNGSSAPNPTSTTGFDAFDGSETAAKELGPVALIVASCHVGSARRPQGGKGPMWSSRVGKEWPPRPRIHSDLGKRSADPRLSWPKRTFSHALFRSVCALGGRVNHRREACSNWVFIAPAEAVNAESITQGDSFNQFQGFRDPLLCAPSRVCALYLTINGWKNGKHLYP